MEATTVSERPKGVVWIEETFYLVPHWTVEPDSEAVRAVISKLNLLQNPSTQHVHTSFLTQGCLNRVYVIRIAESLDNELIMRLSLPVEPTWKTLSEVATIEWVRQNTSLPVPRIFAHDADQDNILGLEWILMTKIPGNTLADAWKSMDFPTKKRLVQQMASFSSSLFKKQLCGIGNIYSASDDRPAVERIVSMKFFWGDRERSSVSRGSFRSTKDWLEARLSIAEHDEHCTISRCAEKEDLTKKERSQAKRAVRVLRTIRRLKLLIHSDLHSHFPCSKQNDH